MADLDTNDAVSIGSILLPCIFLWMWQLETTKIIDFNQGFYTILLQRRYAL